MRNTKYDTRKHMHQHEMQTFADMLKEMPVQQLIDVADDFLQSLAEAKDGLDDKLTEAVALLTSIVAKQVEPTTVKEALQEAVKILIRKGLYSPQIFRQTYWRRYEQST